MTVVCQIFNDTSIFVCTDCLIRGVNSVNMFSSLEGSITCANCEVMTIVIKFYDNDYYKWCKDHCVLLNNDELTHTIINILPKKMKAGIITTVRIHFGVCMVVYWPMMLGFAAINFIHSYYHYRMNQHVGTLLQNSLHYCR